VHVTTRTAPSALPLYEPHLVERKWQRVWRRASSFSTPRSDDTRPPHFIFVTPPFTTGDAHLGHVRSYTIGDAYARYKRMSGFAVLFSLGFDAFGLPAELSADEHDIAPSEWVNRCITRMKAQFDRLGLSFDWSRSFASSEPDIYRWTQAVFLSLLESGLIYRRETYVDWCDQCQTVLANSQTEKGLCWRCNAPVRPMRKAQWFLRLTTYNSENHRRLEDLDWNGPAIGAQHAVLGRIDGEEFDCYWPDGTELVVFAPAGMPTGRAEFVLLSPLHPAIEEHRELMDALAAHPTGEVQRARSRTKRRASAIPVLDTGLKVHAPALGRELPVLVSPTVDDRVGISALFGVPAVNRTDRAIAERLSLATASRTDGLDVGAPSGKSTCRFRATDFPISRQRAWGTPIPVIHCPQCGPVPVPLGDLPVRLPHELDLRGVQNLGDIPDFAWCPCPRCGLSASRETDTLDCHVDAAWASVPLAVPQEERAEAMFSSDELRRWIPVDQLVMGSDTGSFMLDMRMTTKALRDAGPLEFVEDGEPYAAALMHGMVLLSDRKMSKHLGNTVSPQDLMDEFGADAIRLAVLYTTRPERDLPWNDDARRALRHCANFLHRLWTFAGRIMAAGDMPRKADMDSRDEISVGMLESANRACFEVTASLNDLAMHRATRGAMRFLNDLMSIGRQCERGQLSLSKESDAVLRTSLLLGLRLLAPFAPHICEELWARAGQQELLALESWPRQVPLTADRSKTPAMDEVLNS
jgi:leucyl-tRNA synthetase